MISIVQKSIPTKSEKLQTAKAALEKVLARKDLGFHQLPERDHLWSEIKSAASQLREQADELVVVGIGGSSLGPRALYELLAPQTPIKGKKLHFCDNVDALEFEFLFSQFKDWSRVAWVFISKSGSTIETLVSADFIHQKYQARQMSPTCLIISEKKTNPLEQWGKKLNLTHLEIPLDVGGRYSVLTAVGMLPMEFLGFSGADFRQGAQKILQQKDLISEMVAQVIQSFEREEWISFFWFYGAGYQNLGRWLQQLWAESLAKTQSRSGGAAKRVSTPMWAIGPSDQHSLLQQVMDGAKDKFVVFQRVQVIENAGEKLGTTQFSNQDFFLGHTMGQLIRAQAQGTCQALNEHKISTMTLEVEDASSKCLGAQLFFWQLVVASVAEVLDINAFDQPGVELGKRLAKAILKS